MLIQENINLLPYNSFQLSCIAKYFCVINSKEDFSELMESTIYTENELLFLGGGSNILLTKETFDGLVIKNELIGKEIIEETDDTVTIQVGAGENRDEFVKRTIKQGWHGIENLISIPGTVGAAPMQNIGAYGVEVANVVMNVQGVDLPSKMEIILAKYECNFGYRESIFKHDLKNKFFITHVTFLLHKFRRGEYSPKIHYGAIQEKLKEFSDDDLTPLMVSQAIAEIRESKLPNWEEIGTAGSFFKNPLVSKVKFKELQSISSDISGYEVGEKIKLNAGQLIDMAGLKGLKQGNVGTYHKHALVLINHGGGTGEEIANLASRIQTIVLETFGVEIVPEVNYITG